MNRDAQDRPQQPIRTRPAAPAGAVASTTPVAPPPTPIFSDGPVAASPAHRVAAQAATPVYPRSGERRRSPRQTLVAKAVVRSEANSNTVATGFLSNISMLGVGFHTRKPLTVGEKFQLSLELGPMKWATRLRVVACQQHDSGTFDVGAEFIGSDLTAVVARGVAA